MNSKKKNELNMELENYHFQCINQIFEDDDREEEKKQQMNNNNTYGHKTFDNKGMLTDSPQ